MSRKPTWKRTRPSRTVVLCYRIHLESRRSASGLRLGGFVIHANLGNLGRLLAGLQQ
jgi:hypothetical protein